MCAEGIAIRTLPDERSPRTGEILRQGQKFTAVEAVDGIENDPSRLAQKLFQRAHKAMQYYAMLCNAMQCYACGQLTLALGAWQLRTLPKASRWPWLGLQR